MAAKSGKKSRHEATRQDRRSCLSCGARVPADARFCPACGARPDASPQAAAKARTRLVGGFAAAILVAGALTGGFVYWLQQEDGAGAPPPVAARPAAPAAAPAGTPPDLSTMSPREAADRLFNRVMRASEQGRADEAAQFAPMAIQAYSNLAALDRDARYHLGLMHLVTGDLAGVAAQVAALRAETPDHLLALVLQHDVAVRTGDTAAAAQAQAELQAAYDGEIATAKPEYEAHRNVIDALRSGAGPAAAAPAAASPAEDAASGAALFAVNCAVCHGVGGVGSALGPPLMHEYYAPGHHDDDAIRRAIRLGVQPHHWQFGPMPPVAGISDAGIEKIVAYIRERQRAAGIE